MDLDALGALRDVLLTVNAPEARWDGFRLLVTFADYSTWTDGAAPMRRRHQSCSVHETGSNRSENQRKSRAKSRRHAGALSACSLIAV